MSTQVSSVESSHIFEIWAWHKIPEGKYDIVCELKSNSYDETMAKARELKNAGSDCLKIYWR